MQQIQCIMLFWYLGNCTDIQSITLCKAIFLMNGGSKCQNKKNIYLRLDIHI